MYTVEWKPQSTDANPAVFSGSVTLKVPKHVERMKVLKNLETVINSNGELVVATGLDKSEKLIEFSKNQIEKIELMRVEDKFVVPDIEWLEYDADGYTVLEDIATMLIQGVKLGKS